VCERRGGEGGRWAVALWRGGNVGWRSGGAVEREARWRMRSPRRRGRAAALCEVSFFNGLGLARVDEQIRIIVGGGPWASADGYPSTETTRNFLFYEWPKPNET